MSEKREYGLQLFILIAAFFLIMGFTRGQDPINTINPESPISLHLAEEEWAEQLINDQ